MKSKNPGLVFDPDQTRSEPNEYVRRSCLSSKGHISQKIPSSENEIAIIDMEAGVEHFGRGVDEGIDRVLLLVEPSFEAIAMAEKIKGLASGLGSAVSAVLNKIDSEGMAVRLEGELRVRDIEIIGTLPNDPFVFEACLEGRSLSRGKAFHVAGKILNRLLSKDRDMN